MSSSFITLSVTVSGYLSMKLIPLISVTRGHKYRFCHFYIAIIAATTLLNYMWPVLEQNYHYSKKLADEIYVKEQLATANNYWYVFMNNCIHIHQFSFKITTIVNALSFYCSLCPLWIWESMVPIPCIDH